MKGQALLLIAPLAAFSLGCSTGVSTLGTGGTSGAFGGAGRIGTETGEGGGGNAGTKGILKRGGMADPVVLDISGRWGMFAFEDPVGVELVEAPDGTLTGSGCAAGAPGSASSSGHLYFCGAITGKVTGETATFSFPLNDFTDVVYSARVTISRDGQRMAGDFNAVAGPVGPMAWLRVRWDAPWLDRPPWTEDDPLAGGYALELMADASVGSEFQAGTVYELRYFERSLGGDFGGFWNSEISDPSEGSPLRVGPVPITVPTLPTSLSVDFDATGVVGVTASTPSGGLYRFTAKRR